MANTIKIRRSAVASAVPTTGQLALGELAVNTNDGKLYIKKDNGTASIVEIGGGSVSDGDKGDITVSASGATWTIDNGAITDAKIAAGAEIAVSKLADGNARQLLQTDAAGTGVEWTDNVDIPGTLDVTGVTNTDSRLIVNSQSGPSLNAYFVAYSSSGGYLDNVTAASSTSNWYGMQTTGPLISAQNTNVTYNRAASLYIQGPPTAGTNVTITNSYSLYIFDGRSYLAGDVECASNVYANNLYAYSSAKAQSFILAATPQTSSPVISLALPVTLTASRTIRFPDAAGTVVLGDATTGDITLRAQADLRFADADSSNWVAFQAPATVAANVTWTLPATDGSSGQVLSTNGTGTLSWATAAGGGGQAYTFSGTAPSSPAVGDEWFDSSTGILYTRINDGNTTQWVETGVPGAIGPSGAQGATGNTGATGNRGGVPYAFSTTVTDTDPGNGNIRYNNITIGSVTQIFIDNLDALGNTQTGWYDTWDDASNSIEGQLYITSSGSSGSKVNVFNVTGVVTATGGGTGYYKIPVAYVSGTLPANAEGLVIGFARSGDSTPRSATILTPTASEKVPLFYTANAFTVKELRAVVAGTSPSITFSIRYGSDFSAAGTAVVTNGTVANNTTSGTSVTSFNNATIAAGSFVWLTTTALTGSVSMLHVSIIL